MCLHALFRASCTYIVHDAQGLNGALAGLLPRRMPCLDCCHHTTMYRSITHNNSYVIVVATTCVSLSPLTILARALLLYFAAYPIAIVCRLRQTCYRPDAGGCWEWRPYLQSCKWSVCASCPSLPGAPPILVQLTQAEWRQHGVCHLAQRYAECCVRCLPTDSMEQAFLLKCFPPYPSPTDFLV